MDTNPKDSQQQPRQLKGLYKGVKISVRALDITIAVCVILILVVAFTGIRDGGFLVTFDSNGGSEVESVKLDYGAFVPEPAVPTREGYVFTGWYTAPTLEEKWSFSHHTVEGALTLYAGWDAE